jgi:hypothetical protein
LLLILLLLLLLLLPWSRGSTEAGELGVDCF